MRKNNHHVPPKVTLAPFSASKMGHHMRSKTTSMVAAARGSMRSLVAANPNETTVQGLIVVASI